MTANDMISVTEIQNQGASLNEANEIGMFIGILALLSLVALTALCIMNNRSSTHQSSSARFVGMGNEKRSVEDAYTQNSRKCDEEEDNRVLEQDSKMTYLLYKQKPSFFERLTGCFGRNKRMTKPSVISTPSISSLRTEYETVVEKTAIQRVPLVTVATEEDLEEKLSEIRGSTNESQKSSPEDEKTPKISNLSSEFPEKRSQVTFTLHSGIVSKKPTSSITSELASTLPTGTKIEIPPSESYFAIIPSRENFRGRYSRGGRVSNSATELLRIPEDRVLSPSGSYGTLLKQTSFSREKSKPHIAGHENTIGSDDCILNEYELASMSMGSAEDAEKGFPFKSTTIPKISTITKLGLSYYAFIPVNTGFDNRREANLKHSASEGVPSPVHELHPHTEKNSDNMSQVRYRYFAYIPQVNVVDMKQGNVHKPESHEPSIHLESCKEEEKDYDDNGSSTPSTLQHTPKTLTSHIAFIPPVTTKQNRQDPTHSHNKLQTPEPHTDINVDFSKALPTTKDTSTLCCATSYFVCIPQTESTNRSGRPSTSATELLRIPEDRVLSPSGSYGALLTQTPSAREKSKSHVAEQEKIIGSDEDCILNEYELASTSMGTVEDEESYSFQSTRTPRISTIKKLGLSYYALVPANTGLDNRRGSNLKHPASGLVPSPVHGLHPHTENNSARLLTPSDNMSQVTNLPQVNVADMKEGNVHKSESQSSSIHLESCKEEEEEKDDESFTSSTLQHTPKTLSSYIAYIPQFTTKQNMQETNNDYPTHSYNQLQTPEPHSDINVESHSFQSTMTPRISTITRSGLSYYALVPANTGVDSRRGSNLKPSDLASFPVHELHPHMENNSACLLTPSDMKEENVHKSEEEKDDDEGKDDESFTPSTLEHTPKTLSSYIAYIPQFTTKQNRQETMNDYPTHSYNQLQTPEPHSDINVDFAKALQTTKDTSTLSGATSYLVYIPQTESTNRSETESTYKSHELSQNNNISRTAVKDKQKPVSTTESKLSYKNSVRNSDKCEDSISRSSSALESILKCETYISSNDDGAHSRESKAEITTKTCSPMQSQRAKIIKSEGIKPSSSISSTVKDARPDVSSVGSHIESFSAKIHTALQEAILHSFNIEDSTSCPTTISMSTTTIAMPVGTPNRPQMPSRHSTRNIKVKRDSDLLHNGDDDDDNDEDQHRRLQYVHIEKGNESDGKNISPELLNQLVSILIDSNYKDPIPKDPLVTSSAMLNQIPETSNAVVLQESVSAIGASMYPTTPRVSVSELKREPEQATVDICGVTSYNKSESAKESSFQEYSKPTRQLQNLQQPISRSSSKISPTQSSRQNRSENVHATEWGAEVHKNLNTSKPKPGKSVSFRHPETTHEQLSHPEMEMEMRYDQNSSLYNEQTMLTEAGKTYPFSHDHFSQIQPHSFYSKQSTSSDYISNNIPQHVYDSRYAEQCSIRNNAGPNLLGESSKQNVESPSFRHSIKKGAIKQMNVMEQTVHSSKLPQDRDNLSQVSSTGAKPKTTRIPKITKQIHDYHRCSLSDCNNATSELNTKSKSNWTEKIYRKRQLEEIEDGTTENIKQNLEISTKHKKTSNQDLEMYGNRQSENTGSDIIENVAQNQEIPTKYNKTSSESLEVHGSKQSEEIGCSIIENVNQNREIPTKYKKASNQSMQIYSNRESEEIGCDIIENVSKHKEITSKFKKTSNQPMQIYASIQSEEIGRNIIDDVSKHKEIPSKFKKTSNQIYASIQSEEIGCNIIEDVSKHQENPSKFKKTSNQPMQIYASRQSEEIGCNIIEDVSKHKEIPSKFKKTSTQPMQIYASIQSEEIGCNIIEDVSKHQENPSKFKKTSNQPMQIYANRQSEEIGCNIIEDVSKHKEIPSKFKKTSTQPMQIYASIQSEETGCNIIENVSKHNEIPSKFKKISNQIYASRQSEEIGCNIIEDVSKHQEIPSQFKKTSNHIYASIQSEEIGCSIIEDVSKHEDITSKYKKTSTQPMQIYASIQSEETGCNIFEDVSKHNEIPSKFKKISNQIYVSRQSEEIGCDIIEDISKHQEIPFKSKKTSDQPMQLYASRHSEEIGCNIIDDFSKHKEISSKFKKTNNQIFASRHSEEIGCAIIKDIRKHKENPFKPKKTSDQPMQIYASRQSEEIGCNIIEDVSKHQEIPSKFKKTSTQPMQIYASRQSEEIGCDTLEDSSQREAVLSRYSKTRNKIEQIHDDKRSEEGSSGKFIWQKNSEPVYTADVTQVPMFGDTTRIGDSSSVTLPETCSEKRNLERISSEILHNLTNTQQVQTIMSPHLLSAESSSRNQSLGAQSSTMQYDIEKATVPQNATSEQSNKFEGNRSTTSNTFTEVKHEKSIHEESQSDMNMSQSDEDSATQSSSPNIPDVQKRQVDMSDIQQNTQGTTLRWKIIIKHHHDPGEEQPIPKKPTALSLSPDSESEVSSTIYDIETSRTNKAPSISSSEDGET